MEASRAEAESFAGALSAELGDQRRDDFAAAVAELSGESVTESAVSLWLGAKSEPSRRKVFAMERVLGVPPGALSRHLGYLPVEAVPARNIEDALVAAGVPKDLRRALIAAINSVGG